MAGEWLEKVNRPNYKERADYGIRVARPGFDAATCAQNQLLFNSGWPILQIVKVIKLDKLEPIEWIQHSYTVYHIDKETWETISEEKTAEVVNSFPPGATPYTHYPEIGDPVRLSVNRRFILKRNSGDEVQTVTYTDWREEPDYYVQTIDQYDKYKGYRKKHGLDFVPFFLDATGLFGGLSDYVLLFSVDITKDVDYPYTESPLPFVGEVGDYGIKSTSEFGENVPGLCSNMFSKLVQAVKTHDTSTYQDQYVYWSPMQKWTGDPRGVLRPYEFYAFYTPGYKLDEGGEYYGRSYSTFKNDSGVLGDYSDSYVVATDSFMMIPEAPAHTALVVLRSPMVSPEYEELV